MSIVVGVLVGPILNKNKLQVCKTGTDEDGSDNYHDLFPVNCGLTEVFSQLQGTQTIHSPAQIKGQFGVCNYPTLIDFPSSTSWMM